MRAVIGLIAVALCACSNGDGSSVSQIAGPEIAQVIDPAPKSKPKKKPAPKTPAVPTTTQVVDSTPEPEPVDCPDGEVPVGITGDGENLCIVQAPEPVYDDRPPPPGTPYPVNGECPKGWSWNPLTTPYCVIQG